MSVHTSLIFQRGYRKLFKNGWFLVLVLAYGIGMAVAASKFA